MSLGKKARHSGDRSPRGYRQASYPPPKPPPSEGRARHRAAKAKQIGPRRMALEGRRRTRRRKQGAAGLALSVTVALVVAAGTIFTVSKVRDGGKPDAAERAVLADPVATTLIFGTKESHGGSAGGAVWLTLLFRDKVSGEGGVVYMPAHTAAEIPGRGLQPLGETLTYGGIPLLLVSVENLLGVGIDNYLEFSDRDARVFFESTGALSVDVPSEVRVPAGGGQARVLFTEGRQTLDATFLEKLLYRTGIDGDEMELGGRHLLFWDALLNHFEAAPDELIDDVRQSAASFGESDADVDQIALTLAALAELSVDKRNIVLLPVRQFGVGSQELYAADSVELEKFVNDVLGESAALEDSVRVQILNGNGVPGIGQRVAERLLGEGFRVILSGNASRLDYKKTLIVTYDSSAEGQALAGRARDLLGVGEVQVSVQEQGIVDLTIVVGKDFLKTL